MCVTEKILKSDMHKNGSDYLENIPAAIATAMATATATATAMAIRLYHKIKITLVLHLRAKMRRKAD